MSPSVSLLVFAFALGVMAEAPPLPPISIPTVTPDVAPDVEPAGYGVPVIPVAPKGGYLFPFYSKDIAAAVEAAGGTEEAARREYRELHDEFAFLNSFGIRNMGVIPAKVCALPEEYWSAYRGHFESMRGFGAGLRDRYPLGWAVLQAEKSGAQYTNDRIIELEAQAKVQVPRLVEARGQCKYAAEGLAATPDGRTALAKAGSPFGGKSAPSTGQLDKVFDGAREHAGGEERVAGPQAAAGAEGGGAVPGLKTSAVPLESFETLTAGIVFSGPDEVPGFLGIMKDNPAKETFNEALRHLYSIPAGKEVLRGVQAMLARTAKSMEAYLPELKAEMAKEEAELARLKNDPNADPARVKELEESMAANRDFVLPSIEGGAKPRVTVLFADTPHGVGGTAAGHFQIWKFDTEEKPAQVLPVVLNPRILKDGNPGRAVDKLLSHELQHAADCGLLNHDHRGGTQWLLIEDRAFLQEAKAALQQREAMRKEPPSAFVQGMLDGDAAPMLRDPAAARHSLLTRPNYVWHVTPADFSDPESALRSRLATAYRILAAAPKSSLAAEVKTLERPGPGIGEAFRLARATARKKGDFYGEEAHFIELAASSAAGKAWLKAVTSMGSDFNADTPDGRAKREKYKELEREYFSGLGTLAAGGESAR